VLDCLNHRRPGYSWRSCVSAELRCVSPSEVILTLRSTKINGLNNWRYASKNLGGGGGRAPTLKTKGAENSKFSARYPCHFLRPSLRSQCLPQNDKERLRNCGCTRIASLANRPSLTQRVMILLRAKGPPGSRLRGHSTVEGPRISLAACAWVAPSLRVVTSMSAHPQRWMDLWILSSNQSQVVLWASFCQRHLTP
jgi:hypothetical protein